MSTTFSTPLSYLTWGFKTASKEQSLGTLGNSIAGIVGGGLGGQLLSALGVLEGAAGAGAQAGSLDIGSIMEMWLAPALVVLFS